MRGKEMGGPGKSDVRSKRDVDLALAEQPALQYVLKISSPPKACALLILRKFINTPNQDL